jgi:hypothetical protein
MKFREEHRDNDRIDKDIAMLIQRWLSGTPTSIYDALIGSGELKLVSSEELRNELMELKVNQEFIPLFEEIQVKFVDERLSPFLNKYINRGAIRLKGSKNFRFTMPNGFYQKIGKFIAFN